ncbi:LysR substrate-binding domain-containing protein [Novosphingobium sp. BL-8A]|uniref:LysR substrate-binding domain-containing protein n=1 Tax=Novosphingobium sp. BL-8A TaxID=3127639 RepID=UPI003757C581
MTLEQLRIFIAVAEREHVTAAAKALHITQSAASAAIAALEERHAVKLFDRVGRGIALTEAGRLFLAEARGVLARADAAETVLEELSGLRRGRLRLVASQTTAAYWLPPILAEFQARHPALRVELAIGNTDQAAARVREGEADLGIVEGRIDDPVLAQWPVGEDRLVLVGATPFAEGRIDARWLRRARWIMREPGSGTRSSLDAHLREHGVDPAALDVALVLPSNESVRTAVEAGAGVAALSSLVVAPALAAGTLHAAPLEFGPRAFHGLRHRERYRSRAADALLQVIAASRPIPQS